MSYSTQEHTQKQQCDPAMSLPVCITELVRAGPFHQARHHPGSFVTARKEGPLPGSEVAAKVPGIQGSSWKTQRGWLNMLMMVDKQRSEVKVH